MNKAREKGKEMKKEVNVKKLKGKKEKKDKNRRKKGIAKLTTVRKLKK